MFYSRPGAWPKAGPVTRLRAGRGGQLAAAAAGGRADGGGCVGSSDGIGAHLTKIDILDKIDVLDRFRPFLELLDLKNGSGSKFQLQKW